MPETGTKKLPPTMSSLGWGLNWLPGNKTMPASKMKMDETGTKQAVADKEASLQSLAGTGDLVI
jgi:hypothetical protein